MSNKTAVVVSTCQKYKNLWEPFFYFFNKFWQDCPYNVYLATDFGIYGGATVLEGKNSSWATNMRNVLSQIPEQTFIMILDDFFLMNKIDNSILNSYVDYMIDNKIGCIRLFPCPGPDKPWSQRNDLGFISSSQQYRMSLQTALWDKKVFLDLLKDGENIWEMELYGTTRTKIRPEPFLSVHRKDNMEEIMFAYVMGALGEKWTQQAIDYCKLNNLNVDFTI